MVARSAVAGILFALGIGCGGSPIQPSAPGLGEPFELRYGASATLDGGVTVTFTGVPADSRCPMDAMCVWAGEAIVAVNITLPTALPNGVAAPPACDVTGLRADCLLSTTNGKTTAPLGDYSIGLVQLAPYPRAATPIRTQDYIATIVVTNVGGV